MLKAQAQTQNSKLKKLKVPLGLRAGVPDKAADVPLGEHLLSDGSIDILENFDSDEGVHERAIELLETE